MDIAKLNPKDFEEILWSRPENNRQASTLIILGGSKDHFAITSRYYMSLANTKGVKLSLVLPDYLAKLVGKKDPNIIFVNSSKSGGYYVRQSLPEIAGIIDGADACLISGEMGNSSETQQFLENLLDDCKVQIILNESALSCFAENYLLKLLSKDNVTLCIDNLALGKLCRCIKFEKAFTTSLGLAQKLQYFEIFTKKYSCALVTSDTGTIWCAKNGKVFYTKSAKNIEQVTADISCWLSSNSKDPLKPIA